MDASREPDSVIQLVVFKAGKDVTGKQWFGDLTEVTRELIVSIHSHFRRYGFQAERSQVAVGAFFLIGVSMNDVPVKSICCGA
jgi:hypothetical protein